ncbi:MAG: DUF1292 domain-containing protein [Ruminococcus sp.]|nr:DUF1292 domain-containing protein [Ruminococcus sp.]
MSEIINENANLPEDEEASENYITLTDDNGEDVSFEMLGTVEYQDRLFAVLIPFDEDDDGVVILELVPTEDPEFEEFLGIDDEKLLNEVFEEFKKTYKGEYEFE